MSQNELTQPIDSTQVLNDAFAKCMESMNRVIESVIRSNKILDKSYVPKLNGKDENNGK